MLCDDCKRNEATFHSIKKINGVTTELHLCADCQKKRGIKFTPFSGVGDIFSNFAGFFGEAPGRLVCRNCGTTGDDFLNTGFLGCDTCYNEFANLLLPRIQQIQHKVVHTGKKPKGVKPSTAKDEYVKLKSQLDAAVEIEDYERAAEISTKIKKLKFDENGGQKNDGKGAAAK